MRGFHGDLDLRQRKTTSGEVKVTKDLDISLEDADVLIVEDIVDSGVTLNYLKHVLEQRKPRSRADCGSARQAGAAAAADVADYVGFTVPDEFVVGFGLDHAEKYRNLDDICVVD